MNIIFKYKSNNLLIALTLYSINNNLIISQ